MISDEMKGTKTSISPGVCPPEGCPPPVRIECVVTEKVYDKCFQVDTLSRNITISRAEFITGPFVIGERVFCNPIGSISCTEISRVEAGGGFFTITLLVTIPMTFTNPNNPPEIVLRNVVFTKTVTLCCPDGIEPDCGESSVLFCNCDVSGITSTDIILACEIQLCLLFKCSAVVQLLVPSYGFCQPAPCFALPGVCPPPPVRTTTTTTTTTTSTSTTTTTETITTTSTTTTSTTTTQGVCECFATGGGNGTIPNDATPAGARGEMFNIGFNACPGCMFNTNVTFVTEIDDEIARLLGPDLISMTCNADNTEATITGSGTFEVGMDSQPVTFVLVVNDPNNSISLRIFDAGMNLIFSTGANPVVTSGGQPIMIRDCPLGG